MTDRGGSRARGRAWRSRGARGLAAARARGFAAACLAASALIGCSSVDPYAATCQDLASPDTLREVGLKLAMDDVQAKVRYEAEIERLCVDAPSSFKPVQRVKPEE